MQEAWDGRWEKLGPFHPRTLSSAKRLLPLLQASDDAPLAARALRSLWEGESMELGPGHPRAVQAARRLAQWLAKQRLLQEAEAVLDCAFRAAKAEEEAEEHAESVSASLGGSEDERSSLSGERAAQVLQSALLAHNFEPKRCLASLTSAARRPKASRVLYSDLQDVRDRLESLAEAAEALDAEEPPAKRHRGNEAMHDSEAKDGTYFFCSEGRRLNPAAASLAFVKSLNSDVDERTREPKGCEVIKEVCKQPEGFNWQTACVCSGNWDYAPVAPTTTTPAVITPAPDVTESSQLEVETTGQATTTPEVAAASVTKAEVVKATTQAPPAPEPPEPEPTLWQHNKKDPKIRPTTTPNPALEKVLPTDAALQKNSNRRLQTVPADSKREDIGPWYGSMGAFCGQWGDDKYLLPLPSFELVAGCSDGMNSAFLNACLAEHSDILRAGRLRVNGEVLEWAPTSQVSPEESLQSLVDAFEQTLRSHFKLSAMPSIASDGMQYAINVSCAGCDACVLWPKRASIFTLDPETGKQQLYGAIGSVRTDFQFPPSPGAVQAYQIEMRVPKWCIGPFRLSFQKRVAVHTDEPLMPAEAEAAPSPPNSRPPFGTQQPKFKGCNRPVARGYGICCRTCNLSNGKRHGPVCERLQGQAASSAADTGVEASPSAGSAPSCDEDEEDTV
eukprot:s266_g3.t1